MENRDPVTGDYPDFPQEEGSKSILNPPPKTQETDLANYGTKDQPIVSKTTKTGTFLLTSRIQRFLLCIAEPASQFISDLEGSVQNYIVKWQDRDEQYNFEQSYDVELMKEELRPSVFEQVRKQVDSEVIIMLQNLKVLSFLQLVVISPFRKCLLLKDSPKARKEARKDPRAKRRKAKETKREKRKRI